MARTRIGIIPNQGITPVVYSIEVLTSGYLAVALRNSAGTEKVNIFDTVASSYKTPPTTPSWFYSYSGYFDTPLEDRFTHKGVRYALRTPSIGLNSTRADIYSYDPITNTWTLLHQSQEFGDSLTSGCPWRLMHGAGDSVQAWFDYFEDKRVYNVGSASWEYSVPSLPQQPGGYVSNSDERIYTGGSSVKFLPFGSVGPWQVLSDIPEAAQSGTLIGVHSGKVHIGTDTARYVFDGSWWVLDKELGTNETLIQYSGYSLDRWLLALTSAGRIVAISNTYPYKVKGLRYYTAFGVHNDKLFGVSGSYLYRDDLTGSVKGRVLNGDTLTPPNCDVTVATADGYVSETVREDGTFGDDYGINLGGTVGTNEFLVDGYYIVPYSIGNAVLPSFGSPSLDLGTIYVTPCGAVSIVINEEYSNWGISDPLYFSIDCVDGYGQSLNQDVEYGYVYLEYVPLGTHTITVTGNNYTTTTMQITVIQDVIDVVVLVRKNVTASGRVVDLSGDPIQGVQIEFGIVWDDGAGAYLPQPVTTDVEGVWQVENLNYGAGYMVHPVKEGSLFMEANEHTTEASYETRPFPTGEDTDNIVLVAVFDDIISDVNFKGFTLTAPEILNTKIASANPSIQLKFPALNGGSSGPALHFKIEAYKDQEMTNLIDEVSSNTGEARFEYCRIGSAWQDVYFSGLPSYVYSLATSGFLVRAKVFVGPLRKVYLRASVGAEF